MSFKTADLCDEHGDAARVVRLDFMQFGLHPKLSGPASTVKVFEDNTRVREALSEPGEGRVLVVDGGDSSRCALVGDRLAQLAIDNGWAGIVVYGCIRDAADIDEMETSVFARGTCPRKSVKRGEGQRDVVVELGGVSIRPGDRVFADPDGVVVLTGD